MNTSEVSRPACCAPGRPAAPQQPAPAVGLAQGSAAPGRHPIQQVTVPAGRFRMGDAFAEGYPSDGEHHLHDVELSGFTIDVTTVTNDAFFRFVEATGYRTEAEHYGFSAVVAPFFVGAQADIVGIPEETPWWFGAQRASWQHPEGRGSDLVGRMDHPVTHVSWNDAIAYCRWAKRRLPTEAEWEWASRGGLEACRYPWGDKLLSEDGNWRCNIWQGDFPARNTGEDGWTTTAPVRTYQPNGWGLWQTVGNVWEWCSDWFAHDAYLRHDASDPGGPASGEAKVMRGGSFLCHDSYCNRYRNAARSANTADSSAANIGFRTVAA